MMKRSTARVKQLSIGLLFASGLIFLKELKIVANSTESAKLSASFLEKKTESLAILPEKLHSNNAVEYQNNNNKSSSKILAGGWTTSIVINGEKVNLTRFYFSDGNYQTFATIKGIYWRILSKGTWNFSNGVIYRKSNSGAEQKETVNFISNNEFYSQNDSNSKWRRVTRKPNLSANQLVGTWGIANVVRTDSGLVKDSSSSIGGPQAKSIRLNRDGTFYYERKKAILSTPIGFHRGGGGINTTRETGTWKYLNLGYGDGMLILKNSQDKVVSFSVLYWRSDGSFMNVYSDTEEKTGRIEIFEPLK